MRAPTPKELERLKKSGLKKVAMVQRLLNDSGQAKTRAILESTGVTTARLVAMTAHHGGSHNLQALLALLKNPDALRRLRDELDITIDQIMTILSYAGGSHNLQALLENRDALKRLRDERVITSDQIMTVLSNDGGSRNLNALLENLDALKRLRDERVITSDQIIAVLSYSGGSHNLKAMLTLFEDPDALKCLRKLGLTTDQIVSVLSHKGGSKTLGTLQAFLKDKTAMDNCRALGLDKPALKTLLITIGRQGASADKLSALRCFLSQKTTLDTLLVKKSVRKAFFAWITKSKVTALSILVLLTSLTARKSTATTAAFTALLESIIGTKTMLQKKQPILFKEATAKLGELRASSQEYPKRASKRPRDEPDSASLSGAQSPSLCPAVAESASSSSSSTTHVTARSPKRHCDEEEPGPESATSAAATSAAATTEAPKGLSSLSILYSDSEEDDLGLGSPVAGPSSSSGHDLPSLNSAVGFFSRPPIQTGHSRADKPKAEHSSVMTGIPN